MTAAAGLPTLRLIRVRIGDWQLDPLQPGELAIDQIRLPGDNSRPAKTTRRRY